MQPMTPLPEDRPPQDPSGGDRVVLVTFQPAGKLIPFRLPAEVRAELGALVVVPTERGPMVATVAVGPRPLAAAGGEPLEAVLRLANAEDLTQEDRNREREVRATLICLELVKRHDLPMKLVKVHYLLGNQKAVFYFTADGRIDFRGLVKDLARDLHVRVEMRQIGVRDETKMVGGVGHCGLELCCSTWLRDIVPVYKPQGQDKKQALNPQKVSGACGRLLCCLAYEHETYVEHRKDLPKVGRRVNTASGPGKVVSLEVLRQRFVVQLEDGNRLLLANEDLLPMPEGSGGPVFSRESRLPTGDEDEGAGDGEMHPADPEAELPDGEDDPS